MSHVSYYCHQMASGSAAGEKFTTSWIYEGGWHVWSCNENRKKM